MVEDAAGMFDEEYYRQQRPDLHNAGIGLWEHYAGYGWREGSRPHFLFDPAHYLAQTAADEAEPFEHYLRHGWREGLWPHRLFDPAYYAAQTGDTGEAPLTHYARIGWRGGLWPHPLFDPTSLPHNAPDGDPLRHYLLTGWRQGVQPHPLFDVGYYLNERRDLAGGVEPLQHYLAHGWSEGSRPHPLFDPVHYRTQGAPDMPELLHYVQHGEAAGLRPNALFSPFYYRAVHAALVGDAPALVHYVRFGEAMGLATAPEFRGARYGSRHLWHGGRPLSHALRHGVARGDSPPAAWPPALRPAFDGPARPLLLVLIGPAGEASAAMLADAGAVTADGVSPCALGFAMTVPDTGTLASWSTDLPDDTPAVLVAGAFVAAADLQRLAAAATERAAHPVILDRAGDVIHAGYVVRDGTASPRGPGWDPAHPDLSYAADGLLTPGPVVAAPLHAVLRACRAGGGAAAVFLRLSAGGRFLPGAHAVLPDVVPGRGGAGPVPSPAAAAQSERPRMLLIDAVVPRAGHGGGSSYMLQLLDTYDGYGFAPTLLPEAELSAPADVLGVVTGRGIRVIQAPFATSSEQYINGTRDEYAVVVISRVTCGGRHLEALRARWPAARIVFHPVDLYHLRETREAVLRDDVAGFAAALRTKARELHVAREADATVVVSEHELDVLRDAGAGSRAVWIEPECADRTPAPYEPSTRHGVAFIGNYRHLPNVDAVQWLCGQVWPLVTRRRPDITLLLVGADMPDEFTDYAGPSVSVLGHVPDLDGLLDGVRLTVAPLRYGAGVKLKLVCSLAAGVPAVCTDIAAEGTGLLPGEGMVLAHTAEAFADAVLALYDDADRLQALSRAGRAAMVRFSPASVRARYREVLAL